MRLIEKIMPENYRILIFGCTHIGAVTCYHKGIEELVKELKKPNTFGIDLGDSLEAITPMDRRMSWAAVDTPRKLLTPQDQMERWIKYFEPVADKILAKGFGNHELKLYNTMDFGKEIANRLEVPYGGYVYKFIAKDADKKVRFKLFLHHGVGKLFSNAKDPVQKIANIKAAMKNRLAGTQISDCIGMFMAHVHKQYIVEPTYLMETLITDRDGRVSQHIREPHHQADDWIPPDARWYGSTGCLRKSYTQPEDDVMDYSEIAMYGASDLGWLELAVKGGALINAIPHKAGKLTHGI